MEAAGKAHSCIQGCRPYQAHIQAGHTLGKKDLVDTVRSIHSPRKQDLFGSSLDRSIALECRTQAVLGMNHG